MDTADIYGWIWWGIMVMVSTFNFMLLAHVLRKYPKAPPQIQPDGAYRIMKYCAIVFTTVCAYRAVLPRIDVTRVCWFDSFLNWTFFGRIAACFAEIGWATQMGLLLRRLAHCERVQFVDSYPMHFEKAGYSVIVLACIAECCSWTNLITESNLFAVFEQFLWMILFEITGIGFILLLHRYSTNTLPRSFWIFGIAMIVIGVEQGVESLGLYLTEYLHDERLHKEYYGFIEGLSRLAQCDTVSHSIDDWLFDALWMTGYFSVGVWSSHRHRPARPPSLTLLHPISAEVDAARGAMIDAVQNVQFF